MADEYDRVKEFARPVIECIRKSANKCEPRKIKLGMFWEEIHEHAKMDRDLADPCFTYLKTLGLIHDFQWDNSEWLSATPQNDIYFYLLENFLERSREFLNSKVLRYEPILKFVQTSGELVDVANDVVLGKYKMDTDCYLLLDYLFNSEDAKNEEWVFLSDIAAYVKTPDAIDGSIVVQKVRKSIIDTIGRINKHAKEKIDVDVLEYKEKECRVVYKKQ